jgi:hypothetical protein
MGIYRCKILLCRCVIAALFVGPDASFDVVIVPSFFGAYLKETSATGYLRGALMPNLRRQDLLKEELLCDSCEVRFAVWEKAYSEWAFRTVQDDDFRQLEYGAWLLPFLVSISWRVLATQHEDVAEKYPQFSSIVERTLESWRLFLLGARRQPGSEHHLFIFAGTPENMPADSHEKTLHYLLRSVDATTAGNGRTFFVYTKALRSLIFSPVVPASPTGWTNTRVHCGLGKLISPQRVAMKGFGEFLTSRVEDCFAQALSDSQKAKIDEAILRDPVKALSSESYMVHKATKRLITRPKTKGHW